MDTLFRLIHLELQKLKHSHTLKIVWILPLLYSLAVMFVFQRPVFKFQSLTSAQLLIYQNIPLKATGALWCGFFHPLALALLPALIFWPEHKGKLWKHLHTQPISRRSFYLGKFIVILTLSATMLGLVWLGLYAGHSFMTMKSPQLQLSFKGYELAKMLGWLWLGSLPLLGLYTWLSDRINSLAVPIFFGFTGLLLTVAMSGQEVDPSWKRDLIPWILPYTCAQQSIQDKSAKQEGHVAASAYKIEANVLRLPSGKKLKTWQSVPDEELFPPPPPTPSRLLALFSLGMGFLMIGIGLWDSGRCRA